MPPVFTFRPGTSDISDFYWTLNETEILALKKTANSGVLPLCFETVTPNFKHFEIVIDGVLKAISSEPYYTWELHEGTNRCVVRSVNQCGVPGIPSWVELEMLEP